MENKKVDIISFLNKKGINEVFKNIEMKEVEDYINKYIKEGLQVGNKYDFNGKYSIHYIIKENMIQALHELFRKYEIDYAVLFDMFAPTTWNLRLSIDYRGISVWENIGAYNFKFKKRENASISNSKFTLTELPIFEIDYMYNKHLSIYDFYMDLLREKRVQMISRYEGEICDYKKCIADRKKMIEELEEILL